MEQITVMMSKPYVKIVGGWTGERPVGLRRTYTTEVKGQRIVQESKEEMRRIIRRKFYPERVKIVFQEEV